MLPNENDDWVVTIAARLIASMYQHTLTRIGDGPTTAVYGPNTMSMARNLVKKLANQEIDLA